MSTSQIIEAIKQLPPGERLSVIEAALQTLHAELPPPKPRMSRAERRRRLAEGAQALLADYESDPELTLFTTLNMDDIYEYEEK